jgi:hypothetical protein
LPRTSPHIEALDALFAAADADEQREVDSARWLARRLRQALVDLDLNDLVEDVDAARGYVTVRAEPRTVIALVELIERMAEGHRRSS